MPRQLNPNYLRRTMQKPILRGLEVVYLTGEQFGVSTRHPEMPDECETLINAPGRLLAIPANYRGWTEPSKLYCTKCWSTLLGVPRDILLGNRCTHCGEPLYRDDDARFDQFGFDLYRDRVKALTGLATQRFRRSILGHEHLTRNGVADGFHKDHVFSVRTAFEFDVDELITSSPVNLRVFEGAKNLSKGRKCDWTKEELIGRYEEFVAECPTWLEEAQAFELRQKTFTRQDWVSEIERARARH